MADEPKPTDFGDATEWLRELDAHYAAIGRVAESWASVELHIDWISWHLAAVSEEVGACLTSQVAGPARKLDAMIALARVRKAPDSLIKKMNDFAKRALEISERRNRVVHDPWIFTSDKKPSRYTVTARRKLIKQFIAVPTTDLISLSLTIDGLWDELIGLHEEAQSLPSLDK